MYRLASDEYLRHEGHSAAAFRAALFVLVFLFVMGNGPALFAQPGERGREQGGERGRDSRRKIKAHPRVAAHRRPGPRVRSLPTEVSLWVISSPVGCKVYV